MTAFGFLEGPELLIVLAVLIILIVVVAIVAVAVSMSQSSAPRQLGLPAPIFPQAGWYSDPSGSGTPRWWDGSQWH